jgi:hypothetical protein
MMRRTLAAAALVLFFVGCDGLIGGEEAARISLQTADDGYAPVRILLKPEMNPVAFTLHADFAWGNRAEAGTWNSYRATLSAGGKVIHTRDFQVNSPENSNPIESSPPPASLLQPVMRVDLPAEAEYEMKIMSLKPATVTLNAPQLVVRINVPPL